MLKTNYCGLKLQQTIKYHTLFFFFFFFYLSNYYICSPTGLIVNSVTFTLLGVDNKNITAFAISLVFKAGITVEILKSVGKYPAAPKNSVSTTPGLILYNI